MLTDKKLSVHPDISTIPNTTLSQEETSTPFPKGATIRSAAANIMRKVSSSQKDEQAVSNPAKAPVTSVSIGSSSHALPLESAPKHPQERKVSGNPSINALKSPKRSISNIHKLLSRMDKKSSVEESGVHSSSVQKPHDQNEKVLKADSSLSRKSSSCSSSTTSKRAFSRRSRTGCLTCRRRRIKCDEHRPFCHNCIKSHKICSGYAHVDAMIRSKILKAQSKAGEHAFRVPAPSYSASQLPGYMPPQYAPANESFVASQPLQWSYPASSQAPGIPAMVPVASPAYPSNVSGSPVLSTRAYVPVNIPQVYAVPPEQFSQQQPHESPAQPPHAYSLSPYTAGPWSYQAPAPINTHVAFPRVIGQQQPQQPQQPQLQQFQQQPYPPPYVTRMLDYQKDQRLLQQQMSGLPAPGPQVFGPQVPQFQQMVTPHPPNSVL